MARQCLSRIGGDSLYQSVFLSALRNSDFNLAGSLLAQPSFKKLEVRWRNRDEYLTGALLIAAIRLGDHPFHQACDLHILAPLYDPGPLPSHSPSAYREDSESHLQFIARGCDEVGVCVIG
ncbi:hypothetical protein GALL_401680 [mine drainage metagenome]|uniref:Uncharacterized protein n=1 Tax=mine drainage metagenome TaxID=410659 RepID=A0A1J5QDX4_9ZZZZ